MADRVRWYNRLAAWLYGVIGEPLQQLAIPAWNEDAEDEEEIERRWQEHQSEMDAVFDAGLERGYRDGREDAGLPW
ncbi:MAG: hypothetical protein AB7I13_00145 [Vicinamibacterales bacterium]